MMSPAKTPRHQVRRHIFVGAALVKIVVRSVTFEETSVGRSIPPEFPVRAMDFHLVGGRVMETSVWFPAGLPGPAQPGGRCFDIHPSRRYRPVFDFNGDVHRLPLSVSHSSAFVHHQRRATARRLSAQNERTKRYRPCAAPFGKRVTSSAESPSGPTTTALCAHREGLPPRIRQGRGERTSDGRRCRTLFPGIPARPSRSSETPRLKPSWGRMPPGNG